MNSNLAIVYPKTDFTLSQYHALECKTGQRHEYYDGEVIAMAGGSFNHSVLCSNINVELGLHLRYKGSKCRTFNSEMKLGIENQNTYLYPDAMVVCGAVGRDYEDPQTITNPILIVEVLSPSSIKRDRIIKFELYKTLPSLREYILTTQSELLIEVYFRNSQKNIWQKKVFRSLENQLISSSLGLSIPIIDIYRDVDF